MIWEKIYVIMAPHCITKYWHLENDMIVAEQLTHCMCGQSGNQPTQGFIWRYKTYSQDWISWYSNSFVSTWSLISTWTLHRKCIQCLLFLSTMLKSSLPRDAIVTMDMSLYSTVVLCFVVFGYTISSWWVIYPYSLGLLHWHWCNHMIAPILPVQSSVILQCQKLAHSSKQ